MPDESVVKVVAKVDGRKKRDTGSWNLSSRRCSESYHAKDHLKIPTRPVRAAGCCGVAKHVALGHHSLSGRDYKTSLSHRSFASFFHPSTHRIIIAFRCIS